MKTRNTIDADVKAAISNLRKISRTIVPESEISALNKCQRRVATLGVKGTAGEAQVPQKVIRSRLKQYRASKRKAYASTYLFRRDVSASSLRPRQNRRGVKAGKHDFPGAFVADGSKGYGRWNKSKKGWSETKLTTTQVMQRAGKGRYGLNVLKIPVADAMKRNFEKSGRQVMTREYSGFLRHELNRRIKRMGINA